MSSFSAKFTNGKETVTVFCRDDYFGQHEYGYVFPDKTVKTKDEMIKEGWKRVDENE